MEALSKLSLKLKQSSLHFLCYSYLCPANPTLHNTSNSGREETKTKNENATKKETTIEHKL